MSPQVVPAPEKLRGWGALSAPTRSCAWCARVPRPPRPPSKHYALSVSMTGPSAKATTTAPSWSIWNVEGLQQGRADGDHYGTILVDLERHRVLDTLPDRQASTLAAWLKVHQGVKIVSRDRASAYAEAAREGAPEAQQVADRFHLLRNLVEALHNLLGRLHPALQHAAKQVSEPAPSPPPETPNPPEQPVPPTCPEVSAPSALTDPSPPTRKQQESAWRRQRRQAVYTQVLDRHTRGESQRAIARATGLSRVSIRHYLRAGAFPERARPARQRERPIAAFEAYLQERLEQGCHNVAKLFRELQERGFAGTYQQVYRYRPRTRPKQTGRVRAPLLAAFPTPSPRASAWMLLLEDAPRDAQEQAFLDALCASCPEVAQARELALGFFALARERRAADLAAWQDQVAQSGLPELHRFAKGLNRDKAAVLAALSLCWSNGQTEGQVNRLKLVKRSMYGRANYDLLRARVLPMTQAA